MAPEPIVIQLDWDETMAAYLLEVIGTNAILATLLAACVFLISKCSHRPALLHCLWIVVLVKFLMPASLNIPLVAVQTEADETIDPSNMSTMALMNLLAAQQAGSTPMGDIATSNRWNSAANTALAIWVVGAAACAVWIAWQSVAFGRILRRARRAPLRLQNQAEAIAFELGLRQCPEVCIVRANISPLLWSMGKSRIVLPAALLRELSREEISGVLAHELMHLKRRDHWLRWLEIAAVAIYWWLPVAWWARRQLRAAEELCCDLAVLERWPAQAKVYASTLLKSNDWLTSRLPVPQTASGFGSAPFLKRRITMILSRNLSRRLSWPARAAVFLAAAAILPLSPMSLRGDDNAGSKTVTIEIKKDGSITVSVGAAPKKPTTDTTSAVERGLQFIARVEEGGGLTIEQADKNRQDPVLKLNSGENSDAGVSGVLTLQKAAEGVASGQPLILTLEGESVVNKDTNLTASGLLLKIAGQDIKVKQPDVSADVQLEFVKSADGKAKEEWKIVKLDGKVEDERKHEGKAADEAQPAEVKGQATKAEEQLGSVLQAMATQAVASQSRIKQKEAQLQQLHAQLKQLQAELEFLRAHEKDDATEKNKAGRQ